MYCCFLQLFCLTILLYVFINHFRRTIYRSEVTYIVELRDTSQTFQHVREISMFFNSVNTVQRIIPQAIVNNHLGTFNDFIVIIIRKANSV